MLDLCCQLRDDYDADVAFFSDKVMDILRSHSLNTDSDITPLDYLGSEFEECRGEMIPAVDIDQWDKKGIEKQVFEPIFRFARWLRVFDKQIGCGTNLQNFRRGLQWLAQIWSDVGVFVENSEAYFKIVTRLGLEDRCHKDPPKVIYKEIVKPLSEQFSFDVKCLIKKTSTDKRFRHARYLQTNQACFLVDRGFDLLCRNGTVRDCEISLKSDPRQVVSKIKALSDYVLINQDGIKDDWKGKRQA